MRNFLLRQALNALLNAADQPARPEYGE
jgi:hypothetical protein